MQLGKDVPAELRDLSTHLALVAHEVHLRETGAPEETRKAVVDYLNALLRRLHGLYAHI